MRTGFVGLVAVCGTETVEAERGSLAAEPLPRERSPDFVLEALLPAPGAPARSLVLILGALSSASQLHYSESLARATV